MLLTIKGSAFGSMTRGKDNDLLEERSEWRREKAVIMLSLDSYPPVEVRIIFYHSGSDLPIRQVLWAQIRAV